MDEFIRRARAEIRGQNERRAADRRGGPNVDNVEVVFDEDDDVLESMVWLRVFKGWC